MGSSRFLYVGSFDYFAQRGIPMCPEDLVRHDCLLHRFPTTGTLEKWPLTRAASKPEVRLSASMTSNHVETLLHMVVQGHGIACLPDFAVKQAVADGALRTVLDDWANCCSTFQVLWPPIGSCHPGFGNLSISWPRTCSWNRIAIRPSVRIE
ncbi:LysR substrate-binding domain-containing protein [Variovorax boronicumulans]|uniref:LysR substrate-binding domain-containing protein n=1 Tax=Variovorax boronicumulans TaxID=436515 RepID=UPI00209C3186|nr:LysR substrate-binding domain-containing protein [Variovorax boronicumulans]